MGRKTGRMEMKQAVYDVVCYIRRDIVKYILLIIQYVLFFILIGNFLLYLKGWEEDTPLFSEKNGYAYFKLVKNSFASSMIDIQNTPMSLDKMQTTLERLKDNQQFIFSSLAFDQDIKVFTSEAQYYFKDDDYDDFLAHSAYSGYYKEYPDNKPIAQMYWNGQETIDMQMCKVDEESMEHYKLALSSGDSFDENDYIYDNTKGTISIILGSEYQKYFQIGDTIRLATPIKIMKATVKGFLRSNSRIENDITYENIGEAPVTLDYSIIVPCFKKIVGIVSDEDRDFATLEYMNNLCGTLIFDKKIKQSVIKENIRGINDYYLNTGIFTVIPLYGNNGLIYLQGEKKEAADILKIIIFLLIVYNGIVFHISLSTFMKKQRDVISIQVLNGKKMKHVLASWFGIIVFVIIISVLLVYVYDRTWKFQEISFHIWILLVTILLIFLNILLFKRKIKKDGMYDLL